MLECQVAVIRKKVAAHEAMEWHIELGRRSLDMDHEDDSYKIGRDYL
jgi:hypothetical protein